MATSTPRPGRQPTPRCDRHPVSMSSCDACDARRRAEREQAALRLKQAGR